MQIVNFVLAVLAALLLVPSAVVFVQVLAALPPRGRQRLPPGPRPRVAVLVPAHDEALVIESTLRGLRAQLATGDRLLVVADNCSDATASIAARAGAEVVERHDRERRGKGYALDFGVRSLAADPPEVLVVIDADCEVSPGAVERIALEALAAGRPVQALYLMRSPPAAGISTEVAELAWLVKNLVRPLGGQRLGMPCQLMGTGMAFPWTTVSSIPFATGHIAEDVLFGIALAEAGAPPRFCPEALVQSEFASTHSSSVSQRRRWEHGNLNLILTHAPRLFFQGVLRADMRLVAMALDLAVPPIALLTLFAVSATAAAGVVAVHGGASLSLWMAMTPLSMIASGVALSWLRFGRTVISLQRLAYVPLYVARKIPLYLAFVLRRQVEWIGTRRGSGKS